MQAKGIKLATLLTAALAAGWALAQAPSSSQSVLGGNYAESNPRVLYQAMRSNEEIRRVLDILGSHRTWVRNNVLVDGRYVADRAVLLVSHDGPAFNVTRVEKGSVESPLSFESNIQFHVWPYSEANAEWVRTMSGSILEHGVYIDTARLSAGALPDSLTKHTGSQVPAIMKEADGQWRFAIRTAPKDTQYDEYKDVRLVMRGNQPIVYILRPGTERVDVTALGPAGGLPTGAALPAGDGGHVPSHGSAAVVASAAPAGVMAYAPDYIEEWVLQP
jgi:hypothetical protein